MLHRLRLTRICLSLAALPLIVILAAAGTDPWGPAYTVGGQNSLEDLSSLSCVGTSWCMAGDETGHAVIITPGHASFMNVDASQPTVDVACASVTFCAEVGNDDSARTFDGSSWSASVDLGNPNARGSEPGALSCAPGGLCVAVAASSRVYLYQSGTWSAETLTIPGSTSGIGPFSSCAGSFCVIVNGGDAWLWNKGSWSGTEDIDGENQLEGVSCTGPSFCMAVDGSGNALRYDGTSWHLYRNADVNPDGFAGVSCATAAMCLAIDDSGNATVYNGRSWSENIQPPGGESSAGFGEVSCSEPSYCETAAENVLIPYVGGAAGLPYAVPDTPVPTSTLTRLLFESIAGGACLAAILILAGIAGKKILSR